MRNYSILLRCAVKGKFKHNNTLLTKIILLWFRWWESWSKVSPLWIHLQFNWRIVVVVSFDEIKVRYPFTSAHIHNSPYAWHCDTLDSSSCSNIWYQIIVYHDIIVMESNLWGYSHVTAPQGLCDLNFQWSCRWLITWSKAEPKHEHTVTCLDSFLF